MRKNYFSAKRQTLGFTLAELLMAVLVISIIMVALAPVITRRAYDSVSNETNRKKGEEIWTNPGTYTFQVPVGINLLEISGSGGGGGGAGAVSKNYTRTYNAVGTKTIYVPKGVSEITFSLYGAGGGGGAGNGAEKDDDCKFPLTIPAMADNGKDLCVSNTQYSAPFKEWMDVVEVDTDSIMDGVCWIATEEKNTAGGICNEVSWPSASPYYKGGGCKKMVCTDDGAERFCMWHAYNLSKETRYNPGTYRLLTQNEFKRLWAASPPSNNYKWIFGEGLDLAIHGYVGPSQTGGKMTFGSQRMKGCTAPSSMACNPFNLHLADKKMVSLRDTYLFPNGGPYHYGPEINDRNGQVRCVRELNNWEQYSGAGGSTGARLTRTINVQSGDELVFVTGDGGLGGNKGGGKGAQGGSTCLEHKRNGVRYVDPNNTSNNGYYCAYGGYGGLGASTSAHGAPYSTLAGCSHNEGCVKSVNGEAGSISKGGKGAQGADGATADLGQGGTAGLGYDSTLYYGGGGGGFCPRGNRTPSNCQKGGKGGIGGFSLMFNQYVPGGGGGAAGAVGLDEDDNYNPIKLKVEEGETITFTIGAGGLGGQFSSAGQDGQDTIVARKGNDNIFTLYGGKKGETGNFDSVCAYDNQGCGIGGLGGLGGKYPNPLLTPNTFLYLNSDINSNGTQGGLDALGYFGGSGARTRLNKSVVCAGYEVNEDTKCAKYDADGNDAQKHNPITNRLGGQGGGGGGVNGKLGGAGGSGSSGYIRIKWDEARQE